MESFLSSAPTRSINCSRSRMIRPAGATIGGREKSRSQSLRDTSLIWSVIRGPISSAARRRLHRARGAEAENPFEAIAASEGVGSTAQSRAFSCVRVRHSGLEGAQQFAFAFRERGIGTVGVMLQAPENFRERIAVILRAAKGIYDPLKTQMQWDRGYVHGSIFGH